MPMLSFLLACSASQPTKKGQPEATPDSQSDSRLESQLDSPLPPSCPENMAHIGSYCIDQYEATLQGWSPFDVPPASPNLAQSLPDVYPQGYISGETAQAACEAAGKRLCTLEEWMGACQNTAHGTATTYPYGNTYDANACNDTCEVHPVVSYWGNDPNMWDSEHMNDPGINQQPDTLAKTGENTGCVTQDQVFDLHGNLHEWIKDTNGTFKGGFYADAAINGTGCNYTTAAHDFSYHDYSTGFRCCTEAHDR